VISGLAKVVYDRVAKLKADRARIEAGEVVRTHVPTGLRAFDERFGGLELGILTLLVGHTGDGKTTVLAHLAEHAARAGFGVLLVLLEDPADKLADRLLAKVTGITANKITRLQVADTARFDAAVPHLEWTKRVGLVAGNYSPDEVLQLVKDTDAVGGAPLGLVVVDYAQGFLDDEIGMEQVCARMARALNGVALERNLSCVFGSQVKSEVLQRGRQRWERTSASGEPDESGFRPGKGDVMWSRRLEQYAKAVWYLFRPGRWRRELGVETARDDVIELHVGKANYSQEGAESFRWDGATSTIADRVSK
jgi:replicative DNA helicase